MSEISTIQARSHEADTGWQQVASEMHAWPIDLQQHAKRQLAARGIAAFEADSLSGVLEFGVDRKEEEDFGAVEQCLLMLAENPRDRELLASLTESPSAFVRWEVASLAAEIVDEPLLSRFENDSEKEISNMVRRKLAEMQVREACLKIDKNKLAIRLSDFSPDTPLGSGRNVLIIQKADRQVLINTFNASEMDINNLQLSYHFRQNEQLDILSWGEISIKHLRDGRKAWVIETLQSDVLQKTKNKELIDEYFEKCADCEGKGSIRISKKQQHRCGVCQGSGLIPLYAENTLKDIQMLASKVGVDTLLVPTGENMASRYLGLLKLTKAKVLYDTIPSLLHFEKMLLDEEVSFGGEDGEARYSKEFWVYNLKHCHVA